MTLCTIDYKEKVEDGKKYERTEFTLGKHYRVIRNVTWFEDGTNYKRFWVSASYEDMRDNYIPEIHYFDGHLDSDKPEFKVQTSAYGAMGTEDIKKIIAGYQEAIEAVAILNKNFC